MTAACAAELVEVRRLPVHGAWLVVAVPLVISRSTCLAPVRGLLVDRAGARLDALAAVLRACRVLAPLALLAAAAAATAAAQCIEFND